LALLDRIVKPTGLSRVLLAHEFMGLPTALAVPDRTAWHSVFYAHEVSTARRIVETTPGQDATFYGAMALAASEGQFIEDVFGDQSLSHRHALVSRSFACGTIFAVGKVTERELRFMGPSFANYPIDLVYNGVPCVPFDLTLIQMSRTKLQDYAEALLGFRPDVVFTHVTRPVRSKGFWRDLQVLTGLDETFRKDGRRGVFFVLSTAVCSRTPADVVRMIEYGWPVSHKIGYPDLEGSEVDVWRAAAGFNEYTEAIRAVCINQFGWDRVSCGPDMPEAMTFEDLRRGSDVEFGLSTYEPFGIAQVEPLSFGTICVVSTVCGCVAAVEAAGGGEPNFLLADYRPDRGTVEEALATTSAEREGLEWERSRTLSGHLGQLLSSTDSDRQNLVESSQATGVGLTWDRVCEDHFLPALNRLGRS